MFAKKILIVINLFSFVQASQDALEPSAKKARTESNSMTLYHALNSENDAQSVQDHGLLSFPRAYENKLVGCSATVTLSAKLDRRKTDDDIYFSPVKTDSSSIGYQIDTVENCFVFNATYRKRREWVKYNNSKIPLKDYLQSVANLKSFKINYPGKIFRLNPDNGQPEVVKAVKRKILQHLNSYDGEVVISAGCIEPKDLIFLKQ